MSLNLSIGSMSNHPPKLRYPPLHEPKEKQVLRRNLQNIFPQKL